MSKQDSIKATATSYASKEKTIMNDKSKGSKMMQQKSGKKRTKYTTLFYIANVSNKSNNQIYNTTTRTNPGKCNTLKKSVDTTDFANRTNVISQKNTEKILKEPIALVVKNKKESIIAQANVLKSKQCKKRILTSENYDREMYKICSAIVDHFLKKAYAEKIAAENIANKNIASIKSTTFDQIVSVDISKNSKDGVYEGLGKACTVKPRGGKKSSI